ncbi:hypothetical protein Emed_007431 [Eimeria media]
MPPTHQQPSQQRDQHNETQLAMDSQPLQLLAQGQKPTEAQLGKSTLSEMRRADDRTAAVDQACAGRQDCGCQALASQVKFAIDSLTVLHSRVLFQALHAQAHPGPSALKQPPQFEGKAPREWLE